MRKTRKTEKTKKEYKKPTERVEELNITTGIDGTAPT